MYKNHEINLEDVNIKRFQGETLGYVTPWNGHGYDCAKRYGNKFTYVAPVWLQIRHTSSRTIEITGTHDIDSDWMEAVRATSTLMVPRFMFELQSLSAEVGKTL